ncbi:MAG: type II toxin-antitoxin system VapC family toxin [Deltaproteobacteria bacterium]|nr:type II toxin-antitoxin system VapC family toxin [Deltaproteobacteria bacterium]
MSGQPSKGRRTYVDASVFGGAFDDEFATDSRAFFEQPATSRFVILTSALVLDEIAQAPADVRGLFDRMLASAELVEVNEAALALQAAYIDAGILTPKWADDALHVALATVAGADLSVSWNFRHIVHFDKAPRYNALNRLRGYREVAIHSPSEVILYEDEQDV